MYFLTYVWKICSSKQWTLIGRNQNELKSVNNLSYAADTAVFANAIFNRPRKKGVYQYNNKLVHLMSWEELAHYSCTDWPSEDEILVCLQVFFNTPPLLIPKLTLTSSHKLALYQIMKQYLFRSRFEIKKLLKSFFY